MGGKDRQAPDLQQAPEESASRCRVHDLGEEAMERFHFAARLLRPRFAKYPLCLGEAHDTSTSEIKRRPLTDRLLSLQMLEVQIITTSEPGYGYIYKCVDHCSSQCLKRTKSDPYSLGMEICRTEAKVDGENTFSSLDVIRLPFYPVGDAVTDVWPHRRAPETRSFVPFIRTFTLTDR